MTRAAVLAPPISQETAHILTRAFSPRPGSTLTSVVVDEQRRRIELTFRTHDGATAKCAIVRERTNL